MTVLLVLGIVCMFLAVDWYWHPGAKRVEKEAYTSPLSHRNGMSKLRDPAGRAEM